MNVITTKKVPIGKLKPWPDNANIGHIATIRESLKINGQYKPIVVDANTLEVIAGNSTYRAALDEGLKQLLCTLIDVTAEEARKINLVDNRSRDLAIWDMDLLADQLKQFELVDFDLEGTGFTVEEAQKVLNSVDEHKPAPEPRSKERLPIECPHCHKTFPAPA